MAMFRAANAINGKLCKAYATIAGMVYEFCFIKTFEATVEKGKSEIPVMGDVWIQHKAGSLSGSASMTVYYISPIFRNIMQSFGKTKVDTYFDMTIINDDPGSEAGIQTLTLHDCNLDSVVATKFDVEADALEEDISLTFSGWDFISKFKETIV